MCSNYNIYCTLLLALGIGMSAPMPLNASEKASISIEIDSSEGKEQIKLQVRQEARAKALEDLQELEEELKELERLKKLEKFEKLKESLKDQEDSEYHNYLKMEKLHPHLQKNKLKLQMKLQKERKNLEKDLSTFQEAAYSAYNNVLGRAIAAFLNEGDFILSKELLSKLYYNKDLPVELRAQALLYLTHCLEALGDKEQAIVGIEEYFKEVAAWDKHEPIPQQSELSSRLSQLVLGRDWVAQPESLRSISVSKPMEAIAAKVPCQSKVNVISFGGQRIDPFYKLFFDVHRHYCQIQEDDYRSKHGAAGGFHSAMFYMTTDWLHIPMMRDKLDDKMQIYVHVPKEHPIPRRYSDLLPMDYDAIEYHLKKGRGIIALDFSGPLPKILIAANTYHQLSKFIEQFNTLEKLPDNGIFTAAIQ